MSETPHPTPPPPERRSFLKWLTVSLGALWGAVLGIPAIAYLIDPRNRAAPAGDFQTVARLSELEVNVPHQAVVVAVRRDAWTLHPSTVVGRVWLMRRPGDKVEAFTTICPHLGCSVNYEPGVKRFICPCHNGTFDLEGRRVEQAGKTNPAPRGMDQLDCRRDPADAELIQVRYQTFKKGLHEKEPVT
jgi:Rieske Fe-S protein